MEYVVGALGAVALSVFGRISGFEKDRSFYPTVLIVIALLYLLFAAIDGRTSVVMIEALFTLIFCGFAIAGYYRGCHIVAVGIAAHGAFDYLHQFFIEDRGVPVWWPGFCAVIDILIGLYVWFGVCQRRSADSA